jgi:hypothetical protein
MLLRNLSVSFESTRHSIRCAVVPGMCQQRLCLCTVSSKDIHGGIALCARMESEISLCRLAHRDSAGCASGYFQQDQSRRLPQL